MKVLKFMGQTVNSGSVAVASFDRIMADPAKAELWRDDLVLVDEFDTSRLLFKDLLRALPADAVVLIAQALRVGIEIGVDDDEKLERVDTGVQACVEDIGGDPDQFWAQVAAIDALFGEPCTGAMGDAVMRACESARKPKLHFAPVLGSAFDVAADDQVRAGVKTDCQKFDQSLLGAAFRVACAA